MSDKLLTTITANPGIRIAALFEKAGIDLGPGGTVLGNLLHDSKVSRQLVRGTFRYEVAR
jgi:hypothetical protein